MLLGCTLDSEGFHPSVSNESSDYYLTPKSKLMIGTSGGLTKGMIEMADGSTREATFNVMVFVTPTPEELKKYKKRTTSARVIEKPKNEPTMITF